MRNAMRLKVLFWVIAFMAVTGLAFCPTGAWAKATPGSLKETPKDRSYSKSPEYRGYNRTGLLSYVYDGAAVNGTFSCNFTTPGVRGGASTPELVLALGAGGIATFNYRGVADSNYCTLEKAINATLVGNETGKMLDREDYYDAGSEIRNFVVTHVRAADLNGDNDHDEVFFYSGKYLYAYSLNRDSGALDYEDSVLICQPGDCNPDSQTAVFNPADLTVFKTDTSNTKAYIAVIAKKQDTTNAGAIFTIEFDGSTNKFDTSSGEPDWDYEVLTFDPTAVYSDSASIDGSSKDYLYVVGGTTVWVGDANYTKVGNSTTDDAVSNKATGSVLSTTRDVFVYSDSDIDTGNTTSRKDAENDEALVFVATAGGIYAFEFDYYSSSFNLMEYSDISTSIVGEVDFKSVYYVDHAGSDATSNGDVNGWLAAAAGDSGLYLFEVDGGNDTLSLSFMGSLDTTGVAENVFFIGGNSTASSIYNLYLADGAGGFKEINGTSMSSSSNRELKLIWQWDESVAPAAIEIVDDDGSNYTTIVLDQAGGIRVYDVNYNTSTNHAPAVWRETGSFNASSEIPHEGKLGFDLAWSSKSTAYGTGSNKAGTAYDMDVVPLGANSYNSVDDHVVFIAAGEAGIKKMLIMNTDASGNSTYARRYDGGAGYRALVSYDTPGTAKGISAYYSSSDSKYYVAVADGDGGVILSSITTTASEFTIDKQFALSGSGAVAEDVLIDYRSGSDAYVYVAYGDSGLLVLDCQSSSSDDFNQWSNPSIAAQLSKTDIGGYALKLASSRDHSDSAYGSSTYYLFILVNTGSGTALTIVDISTPSSPIVKKKAFTDSAIGTITDIAFMYDQSNSDKRYIFASTAGDNSTIRVINVSSPTTPTLTDKLDLTYDSIAIDAQYVGSSNSFVLAGETSTYGDSSGGKGMLARSFLTLTGPQSLSISVSASPSVVELGGTTNLSVSVTGGESPYQYSWSATPKSGSDSGTFDDTTSQTPTWTSPAGSSDKFTMTVEVTDNDGNTGSASVVVNSMATGVSVSNRIGKAGSEVTVPLIIAGVSSTKVDAFGLDVSYDSTKLTFLGVEKSDGLASWQVSGREVSSGTARIAGYADSEANAIPEGELETLLSLKFAIADDITAGTTVSITPVDGTGVDDISGVTLTAGTFKIVCPGDVDGSGLLTPQDALNIFYNTLGLYELEDDEAKVADLNNDGFVTVSDATQVMQSYVTNGGSCE